METDKGAGPPECDNDMQYVLREVTVRFMTNRDDIILRRLMDETEKVVYWVGSKAGPKPEDPVPATEIHTITDEVTGTKLINAAPKCLIKKIEDFNNITFFIGRTNPAVMRHLEKRIKLENEKDQLAKKGKDDQWKAKVNVSTALKQPKIEPEEELLDEAEPVEDIPTEMLGRSKRQRKPRKVYDPSEENSKKQFKAQSDIEKEKEERIEKKKEKLLKKVTTSKPGNKDLEDLSMLSPSNRYMVTTLRVLIPDEEEVMDPKEEAPSPPVPSSSSSKKVSAPSTPASVDSLSPFPNSEGKVKKPVQRKYLKATMSVSEKKQIALKRQIKREKLEKLWETNPKRARREEKEERKRRLLEPDPHSESMDLLAANCDECVTHHGWVDRCFIASPKTTIYDKETCANCSLMCISTLPSVLCLKCRDNSNELSVYAHSAIKAFTEFGPIKGDELSEDDLSEESAVDDLWFLYDKEDLQPRRFLSTADESTSNWCRFVRLAEGNDYNIVLVTKPEGLFLVTSCEINEGKELQLLVPYFGSKQRRLSHALKSECHRCERTFSQSINYQKHWHIVHPLGFRSKKEKCTRCGAITHTQKDMVEHMKEAHAMGVECTVCGQELKDYMSLKNHIRQVHPKPEDAIQCEDCATWYPSREHLRHHRYNMHSNLSFTCMVCNRAFTRKQVLRRHMKTHTGDYKYACDRCGKSFRDSANLKNHLLSHSGIKAYKCDICEQGYATRGGLTLHYKNTHNLYDKNMPEIKRMIPFTYEACLGDSTHVEDKLPKTRGASFRMKKSKLPSMDSTAKSSEPVIMRPSPKVRKSLIKPSVEHVIPVDVRIELGVVDTMETESATQSLIGQPQSLLCRVDETVPSEIVESFVEERQEQDDIETEVGSKENVIEEVILSQDHTYDLAVQQEIVDHNVQVVLQDHPSVQQEEVDGTMQLVLQDHAEAEQAVLMLSDYPRAGAIVDGTVLDDSDVQPTVYISMVNEDGQVVLHAAQ